MQNYQNLNYLVIRDKVINLNEDDIVEFTAKKEININNPSTDFWYATNIKHK